VVFAAKQTQPENAIPENGRPPKHSFVATSRKNVTTSVATLLSKNPGFTELVATLQPGKG
jgi:hypothetical protein